MSSSCSQSSPVNRSSSASRESINDAPSGCALICPCIRGKPNISRCGLWASEEPIAVEEDVLPGCRVISFCS